MLELLTTTLKNLFPRRFTPSFFFQIFEFVSLDKPRPEEGFNNSVNPPYIRLCETFGNVFQESHVPSTQKFLPCDMHPLGTGMRLLVEPLYC